MRKETPGVTILMPCLNEAETLEGCISAAQKGLAAAGKFLIMGDADLSYDFSKITPFLEKLRGGADLVMGCRMPSGGGGIEPGAMPWKHRWIGNPVLTLIGRILFSPIFSYLGLDEKPQP